jgi:hydrogenase nickel incorporation protein HypA/HybF
VHESALAKQLLDMVLEHAAREAAVRVIAVHGWIAESEALRPESLQFHFAAHAAGTPAAAARLELRLTIVQARCNTCGEMYMPDHHLLLCPACQSTQGTLLGRTGLGIEAIEVETG